MLSFLLLIPMIKFNVADEFNDNFYATSKSNKVTYWNLESYDSYWISKFVDDLNTHQWDISVSNKWFLRGAEQANNYLLYNYSFGNNIEWLYSGESYNLVGSRSYRTDICWDESYWYLIVPGYGGTLIYKYTEDFTPIFNDPGFDIQQFTLSPNRQGWAVEWNGSHYFVLFPDQKIVCTYASISLDWPSELQSYNLPLGPFPGIDYNDIAFDNNNWWALGSEGNTMYAYKFYLNWTYSGFKLNLNQLLGIPTIYGSDFQTLEHDGTYWWYSGLDAYTYKIYSNWTYSGERFNIKCNSIALKDMYFYRLNEPSGYVYKYFSENTLVYNISKFYQGNGFAYIQSDHLETLTLKSSLYAQNTSLTSGDIINVDFITNSNSEINMYFYSGNELTKSFILSPLGNSNFQRRIVSLNIEENVSFDQIVFSSTIPDKKYMILYNINCESPNTDHYYEEFYVDPLQSHSLYLPPSGYMGFPLQYKLIIFEDGIKKVDENIYLDDPSNPYYYTFYSPLIIINSPHFNELFGNNTPSFNIEIKNNNGIDKLWYTIDNGLTNTTFTTNGTINQDLWDSLSNGTAIISFYVKDSIGNIGNNSIMVRVDKVGPFVKINSPFSNELFESTSPGFNVEISDVNLDKTWYTINGEQKKYFFLNNGSLDLTAWSALPDGIVIIQFYANDTFGNIGFSEVAIRKDINVPTIAINNPDNNDVIGAIAPNFDLSIEEPHLDYSWYSLNGGNNITFTGLTGTINQVLWDALSEGNIIIKFYANDSAGNIGFAEVTIRKDVNAPVIAINNPQNSDVIGATAPNFNISIEELNLDKTWYSLNGGNNITFTGLIGTIDQALWDALSDGNLIIRFFAIDSAGNIGFQEVTVVKTISQPSPPGIPGYKILLLLGIVSTIVVIIVKKRLNLLN